MQPQRTLIFFVACKRKYFIFSLSLLLFNLCNDTILFFNCSYRWKPFLLWFSRLWYFATEGNYRGNSFLHFKELYVSTPLCIEYVCYINSFKVIFKKYVQIWCYKKLKYVSCLSTFLDVFVLTVTREDFFYRCKGWNHKLWKINSTMWKQCWRGFASVELCNFVSRNLNLAF